MLMHTRHDGRSRQHETGERHARHASMRRGNAYKDRQTAAQHTEQAGEQWCERIALIGCCASRAVGFLRVDLGHGVLVAGVCLGCDLLLLLLAKGERLQVLGCSARRATRAWWRRSKGTGRVGCVGSVRCERAWRGDAESAARSAAIAAGSAPLKVLCARKYGSSIGCTSAIDPSSSSQKDSVMTK